MRKGNRDVMTDHEETAVTLPVEPQRCAGLLTDWYRLHARPLPWRDTPDAYRVWVSEVMLQQTRIEAVLPYFDRFMEALPTVRALAACDEDRLLKLWEGLGYYSRVRNLQKAAVQLMERWEGKLPTDFEALLSLPGIGEYTAGAVASIAYGIRVPAVDGNVLRVLARLTACRGDVLQPSVKRELTAIAREMLPAQEPGRFNQAIMELGETVCLPNTMPRCEDCPLTEVCAAHRLGCEQQLPVRSPKKARTIQEKTVFVLISSVGNRRVLLHKREPSGLLAGLWELPNEEGGLFPEEAARAVEERFEVTPQTVWELPDGKHIFTHVEWRMKGVAMRVSPFPLPDGYCWATAAELAQSYALPSAFRTYSRLLPVLLEQREEEKTE